MSAEKKKRSLFQSFLNGVEKLGNKLPHPFTLFVELTIFVIILSAILKGLSVKIPGSEKTATVVSLLNGSGLRWIVENMLTNFIEFPPFRAVLVTMLGVSLADQTGLFEAFSKKFLIKMRPSLVTGAVIFLGLMSNLASDAGIVFMPALGATIFIALKKDPIIGIAAGYASAASGYFANLLITSHDATLTGITAAAIDIVPITSGAPTHIAINWFMAAASVLVLLPVGTWVTNKIIEPRFSSGEVDLNATSSYSMDVSADEMKGLKAAGISLVVYLVVLAFLSIPENAVFRNPETGKTILAGFNPVIPIIAFAFFVVGLAYGVVSKKIRSEKDVIGIMADSMKSLSGFLVIAFAASQLVGIFKKTNLATVLAIEGADVLKTAGVEGIPLITVFILSLAVINLFLYSGTSKWALLAPVFVPMFGLLGFSPAFTLALYRIADSSTNIISPLFPYLPIVLGLVTQYKKDAGIGTIMSMMLPYSIAFTVSWILLASVWYVLGLPVGPGAPMLL